MWKNVIEPDRPQMKNIIWCRKDALFMVDD
jgi:hypothetical protein